MDIKGIQEARSSPDRILQMNSRSKDLGISKMPNLYIQTHQKTCQTFLGQIYEKHSRRKTSADISIFYSKGKKVAFDLAYLLNC